MMKDKTRQILLAARPSGQVKLSDFTLREIPLPTPSAGELLLRGCFLSLDPICAEGWMTESRMQSH
jgi:NADPH-dependent curcumin reductase